MPDLKLYTIKDLRAWLIDNNPQAGLTEQVIAPVRAYAILNNPYVRDDDAVVAAIYEGDELAAFTACFPEKCNAYCVERKDARIWWASTLWCNPKFQGKGYGLIVIGSLMEAHEGELTLDRWGAAETVEIFNCLGYKTIYTSRYVFSDKTINRATLRGKLAYIYQSITKVIHSLTHALIHSTIHSTIHPQSYTLKYSTFIDGEAYAFMQTHKGSDFYLREQAMLNWILCYPFKQSCVMMNKVMEDTEFTSNALSYFYWTVKVYHRGDLVGVYVLRKDDSTLSVVFLHIEEEYKEHIFLSIVSHIKKMRINTFMTENADLANYVQAYYYFPKKTIGQISLSVPLDLDDMNIDLDNIKVLQFGEGDSFA